MFWTNPDALVDPDSLVERPCTQQTLFQECPVHQGPAAAKKLHLRVKGKGCEGYPAVVGCNGSRTLMLACFHPGEES